MTRRTTRRMTALAIAALSAGAAACDDDLGPVMGATVVEIAAGGEHSCALRTDGSMVCWGRGNVGQLGQGSVASSTKPVRVVGDWIWVSVRAGREHTCALDADGVLACWGSGFHGQLGVGHFADLGGPAVVAGQHRFLQADLGWDHSCGVALDGRALCWGRNDQGQLGNGERQRRNAPVEVDSEQTFTAVAAGGLHSCALDDDARAWCWGLNHLGQLGDGTTVTATTPVAVAGNLRFSRIAAGFTHTCGITVGGRVFCWGSNEHGELGDANLTAAGVATTLPSETALHALRSYVDITAGLYVSCGIDNVGETHCWGRGLYGQVGASGPFNHSVPQALHVPDGARFDRVTVGRGVHACARSRDGIPYCWGESRRGQIGHPRFEFVDVPVPVQGVGDP